MMQDFASVMVLAFSFIFQVLTREQVYDFLVSERVPTFVKEEREHYCIRNQDSLN